MMAPGIRSLPLGPVIGAMFGIAAAILVAATPQWLFEQSLVASGISDAVVFAQPPLGIKARIFAIATALVATGGLVWIAVALAERAMRPGMLSKPITKAAADARGDDALDLDPFVEPSRARSPIFADRELGAPFMSDAVLERIEPAPIELAPVSERSGADAVLEAPLDAPLEAPLEAAEFDLPETDDDPEIAGEASIDALIRRLEAGLARRVDPPPSGPIVVTAATPPIDGRRQDQAEPSPLADDTTRALGTLQRMAAR